MSNEQDYVLGNIIRGFGNVENVESVENYMVLERLDAKQ